MRTITKNTVTYDEFLVVDKHNNPVTGLGDGDFTKNLYDPDGNERANTTGGVTVTINELGNGAYRVNFTPDKLGNWFLLVYHATHHPWGKGENYYCVEQWFDDVINLIKRTLGLSQENYRVLNPTYITKSGQRCMTSATIKIYPTASDCDNNTNEIAEYDIAATFNNQADMISYKVTKV